MASFVINVEIRVLFIRNLLQLSYFNVQKSNEVDLGQHNVELLNYLVESFQFIKCFINNIQSDLISYQFFN